MRAQFKGTNSMGYKKGKMYILATTYNNGYVWVVDINGVGKPTPYTNLETLLDNWYILEIPESDVGSDLYLNIREKAEHGEVNL